MRHFAVLVLPAVLLSACVSVDAAVVRTNELCPSGLTERTTAELYFGRNIGDALGVGEADWAKFLDQEITARFPAGLTVVDASGQWQGADGQVIREPTKVVTIVLAGEAGERGKLDAIRAAYKNRFRQEAVMRVERSACVGF